MMEQFAWGNYSPGVSFMMMPVYADVLGLQGIEFNDQVRRSAYSFEIVNDRVKFFPLPDSSVTEKVWFTVIAGDSHPDETTLAAFPRFCPMAFHPPAIRQRAPHSVIDELFQFTKEDRIGPGDLIR